MFWHWSYGWPFWWWVPFHGVTTLLFTIAVIVLIVAMVRRRPPSYSQPLPTSPARSQALTILEERYARGEIQRDEYLQKKQDLGG